MMANVHEFEVLRVLLEWALMSETADAAHRE